MARIRAVAPGLLSLDAAECDLVHSKRPFAARARPGDYLSSRDSRRSASGLPPVWQVGQYCSEESAKDTSRTVSPQTGQGWPVRPCTRIDVFFSFFSCAAARPPARATASRSTDCSAPYSVSTSSSDSDEPSRNGDSRAACSTSSL